MELIYIRLPKWKSYLYSLLERIKLYKAINSNRYRWNLNRSEVLLLRQMQSKYLPKGVMRKPKSFGYVSLLQSVLIDNVTAATKDEIELAQKFLIVNKLKLEELIMEMKDLKKFAKEVGIKTTEVNKMDENTLTKEIITRVEPQQEYSKELVAFYNDLPDNFFDEAEATGGAEVAETNSNEGAYSIDDVVEVINEYTKVTELKEILADDDVGAMFEGFDPSPHKLAPKLKKAMIEFLKNPPASEETNGEHAETIGLILEMEEEADLVAAFEELQESHFSEVDVESIEDTDQLKAAMLEALGYEAEPEPEPQKKSLLGLMKKKKETAITGKAKLTVKAEEDEFDWFDPEGDIEEMYAQIEQLPMAKAKKFAKAKLQVSCKIGMKKEEVLDAIATKLQEMAEGGVTTSTESEETELTPELVDAAVKAKDKDALASICEQLGIKLNALQKKSIGGMEKKIKDQMGETKPKETKPVQTKLTLGKKKEAVSEEKSVYQVREDLVIEGTAEDAVTNAGSRDYKEKGKSILFIKKRVKTMISIIKIDNDMEE